jgi:hypothetical protein
MNIVAMSVALAAMTLFGVKGAAAQQDQPYCLQTNDGALTCHFQTMDQCQDALKKGPTKTGSCVPNPKTKP